ncbi:MAG: molecular chaperone DnaJ [Porticoccaceae bacterium]
MPRLLLLVLALLALWYGWQYLHSRSPQERKRLLWVWGSVALMLITLLLVGTGRMHWVGAAIAAVIPLIKVIGSIGFRALPLLQWWQRKSGKPSTLRTRGLEVTFNFATGETTGTLFEGPYQGSDLNTLDEGKLREQLAFFQQRDRQSTLLLRAYLLRRGFADGSAAGMDGGDNRPVLSEHDAWQVLGLEPGASREDIVRAHKSLIQKLHPDRGGNDYLAAMINAAKDKLVG